MVSVRSDLTLPHGHQALLEMQGLWTEETRVVTLEQKNLATPGQVGRRLRPNGSSSGNGHRTVAGSAVEAATAVGDVAGAAAAAVVGGAGACRDEGSARNGKGCKDVVRLVEGRWGRGYDESRDLRVDLDLESLRSPYQIFPV